MRDADELLARHAELGELVDGPLRLHDHTLDELKRLVPGAPVALEPRQNVVGGQHGRATAGEAAQPVDVVARDGEPLDVGDIGLQRAHAAQEAQHARHVLGSFQQQADTGAGRARERREESGRKSSSRR